jgi:hypothetical protein
VFRGQAGKSPFSDLAFGLGPAVVFERIVLCSRLIEVGDTRELTASARRFQLLFGISRKDGRDKEKRRGQHK